MPLHIGLTGGIGAGKSTVSARLAELGAVIIDADQIARDIMEPGRGVLEQVVEAFGTSVLDATGALDRAALARIVFQDDDARSRLNGIVHPAVRQEAARQRDAAALRSDFAGVVVEDIPLLAETNQSGRFDGVVVVEADPEDRVQRLVESRGMDADDARARIAAQATDAQRREIATWVIDNSGPPQNTRGQVDNLWATWEQMMDGRS